MTRHYLMAACAVSALSIAGGSLAQTASTPAARTAAVPSGGGTTIGEIVVTAEKREANIQEVPEAVTAFTAQDRNLKGISTVQDMTNFTPGFTYSSQLDRPAMRGLGRATNIYAADSSVAVYYDDFFSNSTFLVGRDDMLIDQVEILLGPQGTLYGRNAIGGLINTISKRPPDEYGGRSPRDRRQLWLHQVRRHGHGADRPAPGLPPVVYDNNQTQRLVEERRAGHAARRRRAARPLCGLPAGVQERQRRHLVRHLCRRLQRRSRRPGLAAGHADGGLLRHGPHRHQSDRLQSQLPLRRRRGAGIGRWPDRNQQSDRHQRQHSRLRPCDHDRYHV